MSPSFLASSSKTAMNSAPMRLRLISGSVTPRIAPRKRADASTWIRFILNASRKVWTTASASPFRRSPLSTKTHVSWSPMARWTRTATTDESTPPESADRLDSRVDEARHRPGPAHAARGEEVIEDRPPLGGVENLRVELNGVELALLVRHRRHRAVRSSGKGHEALGWLKNGVAVAHP